MVVRSPGTYILPCLALALFTHILQAACRSQPCAETDEMHCNRPRILFLNLLMTTGEMIAGDGPRLVPGCRLVIVVV